MEWKIIFYFSKDMMLYVGPCSSHWVSWKEMKDAYYKLGHCYDSIYDYIDEVMSINGLTSDQIHAGQYLTVAYYDTQAR